MTLDKLSWQLDGGFPDELPEEQGMAHMGVFLTWALLRGHGSENITHPNPELVGGLERRELTPVELLPELGIEWLSEDELDEDYWPHAEADYEQFCIAHDDLAKRLGHENSYYLPGSWETYDALAPMLDAREAARRPSPPPLPEPPKAPRRRARRSRERETASDEAKGRGWGHWLVGLGIILVLKTAWRALGDSLESDVKLIVIVVGFAVLALGGILMWRDRKSG